MEALADDLERFARGDAPDRVTLRGGRPWRRTLRRHWRTVAVAALLLAGGLWFGAGALGDWRARREEQARLQRTVEILAPWDRAPPEFFPEDHDRLIQAVWDLASEPLKDLRLRVGGAWVLQLAGRFEDALIFLGPALEAEAREVALLRAWLGLRIRVVRGAAQEGPPLEARYLRPGLVNEEGEGYLNHFVVEDVEPYDLALEEIARRRILAPPTQEEVEELLRSFEEGDVTPAERFLRASVLWISLPADLDADPDAGAVERYFAPFRREARRAAEENAELVWATYIRGAGELRYGDPRIARELLAEATEHRPELPAFHHLLAIAAQRCSERAAALRHFARAAQLYERAGRPCGRLLGSWAWEEARDGNPKAAEQALDRWLGEARGWQDKVFPWLIRAEIAIGERDFEGALSFLDRAATADEHYALPLRRKAWLFEHHLGDPARAARIREAASLRMQQWPVSIEAYLQSSFFGTRPRAPSTFFAAGGAEPIPK
jgi:tetratricopeptide (TPR) repeat protein